MSVKVERLVLKGTGEEMIRQVETWANNVAEKIEYELNHIDASNLNSEIAEQLVTKEELKEEIDKNYKDLRTYIVEKKGAGV